MRLGQSWDVPDEFWILWWRSHELCTLRMHADVEPAGKGPAGKRSAPEFQRQVMDQMERYGRYPMTGPVALDLHFRAVQRNPPGIHRAAKHTLDILGAALPGCERPRRRSVLYHDDRQVKFLYADMDQSRQQDSGENGRTGSVSIVARRARDVIDDLCMAGRLDHVHHDEHDSLFLSPDLPDDPDSDWLAKPGSDLTPLEQYLADAFRFHDITDLQKAILTSTDAILISGLSMYLEGQARADSSGQPAAIFEELQATRRNLLLSDPFTLPLPALPRAAGESEDFARLIADRLEEFRSRWPLFSSLLVPVTLTFLVVPPEQGKDLDNIALTALPIAHKILRPHIAPHLLAPSYRDGDREPWREEALARLRSVNARSVRAYQVIELPRSAQDPPEGTLRLALGPHSHRSWWARAATYLGKAIEQADKCGDLANSTWRSVITSW